jgi:hypothetical protein
MPIVIVTMALFLFSLKLIYHVPKRFVLDIFSTLRRQLTAMGVPGNVVEYMPRDPRVYEKVFDRDNEEQFFAVCPSCCSTYELNSDGLPDILTCIYEENPSSAKCNTQLCQTVCDTLYPILVFRYHKLNNWIRRLLTRPGTLGDVEAAWDRARQPLPEVAKDFWDGKFVRTMVAPDGQPLLAKRANETTLLFSMAIDWFNPYHNKIAGKIASTGVIFMTCLNLPLEDRYKDENIYIVGILPGKKQQTSLDRILAPLVSDLLGYWNEGVTFVGISSPQHVCLIRCALVQLVCDLPAARKAAGFRSHNATFPCSLCFSRRDQFEDLVLFQTPELQRSKEDHLRYARQYRENVSILGKHGAEKELKENPHGVRWSALNDLPYWNPIICTVLDAMHLVLLGLCQFHWRKAWRCDGTSKPANDKNRNSLRESDVHLVKSSNGDLDIDPFDFDDLEENGPEGAVRISATLRENTTLPPEKMQKARKAWVNHQDSQLSNLTIDQLLCLLEENGGSVPHTFTNKQDIADLVIVSAPCASRTFLI